MAMAWYVVHTYSGYEQKAKQALDQRIQALGMADRFGAVLVPMEQGVEVKGGQKRVVQRKFYPGYILVQMDLDNETWHVVRDTPRITGFVGSARNPPPVPEEEIRRLTHQLEEEEESSSPVAEFERGEEIRLIGGGAFANMTGTVEEVSVARGKLRVMVTMFGRSTPLELDFDEVEKLG